MTIVSVHLGWYNRSIRDNRPSCLRVLEAGKSMVGASADHVLVKVHGWGFCRPCAGEGLLPVHTGFPLLAVSSCGGRGSFLVSFIKQSLISLMRAPPS